MSRTRIAFSLCSFALVGSLCDAQGVLSEPAGTLRSLMKEQIDPNARAIWTAVSYVSSEAGITETAPQTEADWLQLRGSAIALLEASRRLRSLELPVAAPGDDMEIPAFQYTPAEIVLRRAQDQQSWLDAVETLENFTLQTMSSIERRNVESFVEVNARINDACQRCHALFWYRDTL